MVYKPTNNWGAPSYPIFNGGKNSDHVIYRNHYTTGDPPSAAHMLRLPQVRRRVPSLMDTASNTLLQQKNDGKCTWLVVSMPILDTLHLFAIKNGDFP